MNIIDDEQDERQRERERGGRDGRDDLVADVS